MQVKMNVLTRYNRQFLKEGDIVDVDDETAKRWFKHGIASESKEVNSDDEIFDFGDENGSGSVPGDDGAATSTGGTTTPKPGGGTNSRPNKK